MSTTVIIIFVLIVTVISGRILLYDTENGQANEKFDCVYHVYDNGEEIPYCQRLAGDEILNRDERVCENQGQFFSFRDLIIQNILPSDVFDWNSSIEMADLYAQFYYNQSSFKDGDDQFLCKCTQPGTFGKYCEYQLTHYAESFSDAIKAQFEQKRDGDSWNTQKYGKILCYKTLICDHGPLCLDWRDINDGTQQCSYGYDEENWDKLEFNECEDDEFRCTNGMCIPQEFWLDGHVDCMDWSDELDQSSKESCSFTPNAMECDEHICPRHSYSCGDGQCVDWITRMAFQQIFPAKNDCFNKRNLNYMCEVSPHRRAWTLENGLCSPDEGYDDPRYPPSNMINGSTLAHVDKCQYLLRCALSDGFEHDCPCNLLNCTQMMSSVCPNNTFLFYPPPGLINPNILFYYNYNRSGENVAVGGFMFQGSQRCRGYQFTLDKPTLLSFSLSNEIVYFHTNNIFCSLNESSLGYQDYLSPFQYDKFCYNDSLTFNGRPYAVNPDICNRTGECISQYRIHDGFQDCLTEDDEYSDFDKNYCTGNVEKHRFQCFNDQHKCLTLSHLGTGISECSNHYDEIWYGSGAFLKESIVCYKNDTVDCDRLKEYISQSSIKNTNSFAHSLEQTSITQMPFRSYCDSFWDLHNHTDESPLSCQMWVCQDHQYQCRTGQCIELDWVCDGEWDCSDASDEEAIVLITHWSDHNINLVGLHSRLERCYQRYSRSPFSTVCNLSAEFGCYLSNVLNPLDMTMTRPCINLTQIGDGIEDCYNAYDEKNTFEINSDIGNMFGFHLRCGNHYEPYSSACLPEAKNNCSKILCSNHRSKTDLCSGIHDVMCLDGRCVKNGRCNGQSDCFHGEDEYWCAPSTLANQLVYRYNKKTATRSNAYSVLEFPNQKQLSKHITNPRTDYFSIMHSYQCNRGVAILNRNETICLCPPAYYGRWCEFFSDRISVITHIDQKTLLNNTLKIKATLIFEDHIIDDHDFTIIQTVENLKQIKHKFYLVYSRSAQMLTHKRVRYFNRTDVINHHPYSVHFDVFSLEKDNSVKELGSWHYPVYFDYLPAYRLAVVLKFPTWFLNNTTNPCSQHNCNINSTCMPLFNQNDAYYCSCKSGYYGKYCELYLPRCETYCSVNALCRKNSNKLEPDCICPLNRFGPRCNLKHDDCDSNPCLNNGTCFSTDDQSGEASYMCHCSKRFYGNRCQYEMGSVHVDLNMTHLSSIGATVVQLYDIQTPSFQLLIQHQQVSYTIPSKINYYHSAAYAPSLGLLKIYENLTYPEYFIIYSLTQKSVINITSTPEHCPHVSLLLIKSEF
ncbi:unnamed protein product [Adineta steineri]|uniref:EGF-like domain-containing protein n=1 Tax=Adineta steineri TaxID=433720 RepID=A0A813SNE1_9BILA|nr:unnamed protein product [Adineta steineri]CAF1281388.1 unnamed protein product [Adineta steineri]